MENHTSTDSAAQKKRWFMAEFLPDGLPQYLHKFTSINDNLHKSLKEGYLWHSRPAILNDPFDCYHKLLTYEPSKTDIIDFCTRNFKEGELPLTLQIERLLKNPQKLVEAQQDTLQDNINGRGICCFAKNYKKILMWSHYASQHTGVCLVFKPHLDTSFLIVKVRYTNEFVPQNYYGEYRKGVLVMLSTKSKDWKYEQEYRSIGKPGTYSFNKAMLSEVIFGCKTNQDDAYSVMSTIENSGYKNVTYSRAYMEENSFKLGFRPFLSF